MYYYIYNIYIIITYIYTYIYAVYIYICDTSCIYIYKYIIHIYIYTCIIYTYIMYIYTHRFLNTYINQSLKHLFLGVFFWCHQSCDDDVGTRQIDHGSDLLLLFLDVPPNLCRNLHLVIRFYKSPLLYRMYIYIYMVSIRCYRDILCIYIYMHMETSIG